MELQKVNPITWRILLNRKTLKDGKPQTGAAYAGKIIYRPDDNALVFQPRYQMMQPCTYSKEALTEIILAIETAERWDK